ncbi:unnamed protein product, partial [Polarella glacialis]
MAPFLRPGALLAPLLALTGPCWARVADTQYHTYVDPTSRPGLRRTVQRPDGSFLRLMLVDRGRAVWAFAMDEAGEVLGEIELSPETHEQLLVTERQIHDVANWHVPDEEALAARHAFWRQGNQPAPTCAVPE